jgi:superfamily II DNA or RNA helicase
MIRIEVAARVQVLPDNSSSLTSTIVDQLRSLCTHDNPDHPKWLKFRKGRPPPKFITTAERIRGGWAFPRGRLLQIVEVLQQHGLAHEIVDNRSKTSAPLVRWRGDPARGYQDRLITSGLAAIEAGDWAGGVWRAPQGSGKTSAALELVARAGLLALIVVPTRGIFTQWVDRSRLHLGVEPGEIGDGKFRIGHVITIASQQTLWRVEAERLQEFGLVICDEAQLFGAKTYQETIAKIPATYRLAVSGDERRADGKAFLIYDQFGERVEIVTRQEVLDADGAVPVEVVIVPTEFEADWYRALTPEKKFNKRVQLIDKIVADKARNELAIRVAVRAAAAGQQVAILSARRDHCSVLDAVVNIHGASILLMGADREFERNRQLFAEGKARFAVGTYQAIGVGFESHRELAVGVFGSPVVSSNNRMQFMQYLGRFARPAAGKRKATVFYLLDVRVFGKRPAALIRGWVGAARCFVEIDGERAPIDEWLGKRHREETNTSDDSSRDAGGGETAGQQGELDFFGFTRDS